MLSAATLRRVADLVENELGRNKRRRLAGQREVLNASKDVLFDMVEEY